MSLEIVCLSVRRIVVSCKDHKQHKEVVIFNSQNHFKKLEKKKTDSQKKSSK